MELPTEVVQKIILHNYITYLMLIKTNWKNNFDPIWSILPVLNSQITKFKDQIRFESIVCDNRSDSIHSTTPTFSTSLSFLEYEF